MDRQTLCDEHQSWTTPTSLACRCDRIIELINETLTGPAQGADPSGGGDATR